MEGLGKGDRERKLFGEMREGKMPGWEGIVEGLEEKESIREKEGNLTGLERLGKGGKIRMDEGIRENERREGGMKE